ncbi:MAG TPA: hypothetical protein VGN78_09045 [Solirubrobacteraceae bacterium]|jgi:hypothetical protein|nr:hypothetical protein [Solirubrobacteraceae bacterium]
MQQEHLDRLSAVDASFLLQESPGTHMQVQASLAELVTLAQRRTVAPAV